MKAVVITTPGGPEVLQLQEVEDPDYGDDDVLIRVAATALNRADTIQRKGLYPPPKGASHFLGLECSGTVEAVGRNVTRWKIGDQVCSALVLILEVSFVLGKRFDGLFYAVCMGIEIRRERKLGFLIEGLVVVRKLGFLFVYNSGVRASLHKP